MCQYDTEVLRQRYFFVVSAVMLGQMTVFIVGELRLFDDLSSKCPELFEYTGYIGLGNGLIFGEDSSESSIETSI